ncbi:MAG: RCC1 domain-containing protein [Actinomycetota bacterium]
MTNFASIAAGADHSCARTRDGKVKCWGANVHGQLGVGTIGGIEAAPVEAKRLRRVVALTAGDRTSCALTSRGRVYCQGFNGLGTLGIGTTEDSAVPVELPLQERAQAIATGGSVACAAVASGAVSCVGDGSAGQLGNGTYDQSNVPVAVTALAVRQDLPVLSIGDSAVVEGDGGVVRLPFARTLSRPLKSDVVVDFTTYQGSASVFDPDYVTAVGTFLFAKGKTDQGKVATSPGFVIEVFSDTLQEGDEDLYSVLSPPPGADLRRATGRGLILNDDLATDPGLRVNVGDASVVEGDERLRTVNLPISLSAPVTDGRIEVAWEVTGGSADSRVDFRTRKGMVSLRPGVENQTGFAAIRVAGDLLPEVDETIEISIVIKSGSATVGRAVGMATILDDD